MQEWPLLPMFTGNFWDGQGRNFNPHFIVEGNLHPEQFYCLPRIFLLERVTAKPQSQFSWLLLHSFFHISRWCLWAWLSLSSFADPGWCSGHLNPGRGAGARHAVGSPPTLAAVQDPPDARPTLGLRLVPETKPKEHALSGEAPRRESPSAPSRWDYSADWDSMLESERAIHRKETTRQKDPVSAAMPQT